MGPVARDAHAASHGWDVVVGRRVQRRHAAGSDDKKAAAVVTHSHAVLAFHTGGGSRVEQNGGEWRLTAGDVLLVPPGAPHRTLVTEDGSESWGLSFCVPSLAVATPVALLAPFERVRDGGAPIVRIPRERRTFLDALLRELELIGRESRAASETHHAVQRSLLTLILNEVDRAASATASAPSSRSSVVIDSLRFIERSCLGPLSLADVAAAVERSPSYVTTALTRATGRSAVQWIVSGRMAEARRLLLHSDEMVEIIAERIGYADSTHFIRMFRREHGVTPSAWRRAARTSPSDSSGGKRR